ncbi:Conserved putative secreted protein [Amycolatopsis japonica]|uniref:Conserved putative secreted protein n=1 Tax=Amycolatopsis japonica TaxID=208439 RepID=A0A075V566_9PSEU|nr:Conserved putative secreted protein [Amycolatopsis japonica]
MAASFRPSHMRYLTNAIGLGLIVVAVSACGAQNQAAEPAAGPGSGTLSTVPPSPTAPPSSSVPAPTSKPGSQPGVPGAPRQEVPEGSTKLPDKQLDASALPADYPREVYTSNGGTILNIRGQEGGCGHATAEAAQQDGTRVTVNLTELKGQTGQMCTMDIRHPVISVALSAPLGERTVVLKQMR